MSTTGGFEFYLQDRSGGTLDSLAEARPAGWSQAASQRPELRGVSDHLHHRRAAVPHRRRPRQGQGARRADQRDLRHHAEHVRQPLRQRLHLFGRTYRVSLSSEADFRDTPDDLRHVFVRSGQRRHGAAQRAGDASTASAGPTRSTASTSSRRPRSWAAGARLLVRPGDRSDRGGRGHRRCRPTSPSAGPARPTRNWRPPAPARWASSSAWSWCS